MKAAEMEISHEACLKILANPCTEVIFEALGYEYSEKGHARYRQECPNIVPRLVRAIVVELGHSSVFPPAQRLPQTGLFIHKRGEEFVLVHNDKPSDGNEHAFPTAEGA